MMNKIADIEIAPSGLRGFGDLGLENRNIAVGSAADIFNQFLSTVVGVMTIVSFIWFVIQFFIGAIGILSSGGDKAKLTEARGKITSALIGLVVVIAAVFLIEVVGNILGLEILDPAKLIRDIAPGD